MARTAVTVVVAVVTVARAPRQRVLPAPYPSFPDQVSNSLCWFNLTTRLWVASWIRIERKPYSCLSCWRKSCILQDIHLVVLSCKFCCQWIYRTVRCLCPAWMVFPRWRQRTKVTLLESVLLCINCPPVYICFAGLYVAYPTIFMHLGF